MTLVTVIDMVVKMGKVAVTSKLQLNSDFGYKIA